MLKVIGCFLLALLVFQSCKNDEGPVQPNDFLPPSNVKALSKDGSVTLFWTTQSNATGVRIVTLGVDSTLVDSTQVDASITFYTIDSLLNGENYIFYLFSVRDNGEVSNATVFSWGPAQKFSSIRIFEFDSDKERGLQFSTQSTFNLLPSTVRYIDVWLDGSGNMPLKLSNPRFILVSGSGKRDTRIVATANNSLNEQVNVPLLSSFDTIGVSVAQKKVYFAYTYDGHYVRFQVDSIGGAFPERFVDLVYHYNVGYGEWAKR
ncbi:MAG: hypothetical protein HY960_08870 [Ignavibacteriae bacterium]|nr:hypothetical protein [Ignavibacteriota bacterium]